MILHLDLDTFFVSCERWRDASLVGKPVLVGGLSDRGVVASCSYEARSFGIRSAMPMRQARLLCPHAIVIKGDFELYSAKSREVTEIIAQESPLFQKSSIDEFYVDASGMDRFFGTERWMKALRQRIITETGLPISCGLGPNKLVAKIATGQAKPNGELVVPADQVTAFLWPLPVRKIPGVGGKMQQSLEKLGIRTIGQLAATPVQQLQRHLGHDAGQSLWEKAHGIYDSPVSPYREAKSMSHEQTFRQDTADAAFLLQVLAHMAERLGYELRHDGKLATRLTLKMRYGNFETHTKDITIAQTHSDHELMQQARNLFLKVHNVRKPLRLIGLKVSGLVPGQPQLGLFENTGPLLALYQQLDKLKDRHGRKIVQRAAAWQPPQDQGPDGLQDKQPPGKDN